MSPQHQPTAQADRWLLEAKALRGRLAAAIQQELRFAPTNSPRSHAEAVSIEKALLAAALDLLLSPQHPPEPRGGTALEREDAALLAELGAALGPRPLESAMGWER